MKHLVIYVIKVANEIFLWYTLVGDSMDLIVNKFKSMYRMSVVFSIVLFLLGVFY